LVSLLCFLTAARAVECRHLDAAYRVRLIFTAGPTGNVDDTTGADRDGTGTGVITGCGSGGSLAALPTPLGSLTEPLSPRAFAGPGGMPLTPASWAGDLPGAASSASSATPVHATRPISRPRDWIQMGCERHMVGDPWSFIQRART
jgi:hypothetical protein